MKKPIITLLLFLSISLAWFTNAKVAIGEGLYCEDVNRTGYVADSERLAALMNQWLQVRGVRYNASSKEMANTIRNYCKSNPYADGEDVTKHLKNIVDAMTALRGSINK